MKRQEKVEVVQQLRSDIGTSEAIIVTEYKGITVASLHSLRNTLRSKGCKLRVVKNTLLLRAVDETDNEALKDLTGGPIAIAYTTMEGEASGLAKAITEFAKQEKLLVVRGGVLTGKLLEAAGVQELADLPTLDEMRARTLGLFNAPAEKFLNTLLAAPRDLLGVLKAKVDKEESATN